MRGRRSGGCRCALGGGRPRGRWDVVSVGRTRRRRWGWEGGGCGGSGGAPAAQRPLCPPGGAHRTPSHPARGASRPVAAPPSVRLCGYQIACEGRGGGCGGRGAAGARARGVRAGPPRRRGAAAPARPAIQAAAHARRVAPSLADRQRPGRPPATAHPALLLPRHNSWHDTRLLPHPPRSHFICHAARPPGAPTVAGGAAAGASMRRGRTRRRGSRPGRRRQSDARYGRHFEDDEQAGGAGRRAAG